MQQKVLPSPEYIRNITGTFLQEAGLFVFLDRVNRSPEKTSDIFPRLASWDRDAVSDLTAKIRKELARIANDDSYLPVLRLVAAFAAIPQHGSISLGAGFQNTASQLMATEGPLVTHFADRMYTTLKRNDPRRDLMVPFTSPSSLKGANVLTQ